MCVLIKIIVYSKKKLRTKLTHNVKIKNQINNLSKLKWCIHLILPQQHKLYQIFVKKKLNYMGFTAILEYAYNWDTKSKKKYLCSLPFPLLSHHPNRNWNTISANLFYYSIYFCYYLWVLLHFLILFMGPIVLF